MADTQGLNPDFAQRLDQLMAAIRARGGNLVINSGFRTNAQQAALYASEPGLAAPPGHSNHERGLAADLGGSLDIAHQLAPLYGLTFPLGNEPWHIEPVYARNGQVPTGPAPTANSANAPSQADPTDHFISTLNNLLSGGPTNDAFQPVSANTPTDQNASSPTSKTSATPGVNVSGDMNGTFVGVLTGIGAPVTAENLRALAAWQRAEGGSVDNPFNTTQGEPGASNFNSVGVKRYPSQQEGIQALVTTLLNGRYGNIVSALRAGNNAMSVGQAITNSPWGTGPLVEQILGGK